MPVFNGIETPADGRAIRVEAGRLIVPDNPVIPFIEGDGTGRIGRPPSASSTRRSRRLTAASAASSGTKSSRARRPTAGSTNGSRRVR